jgi:hypothetical protein
MQGLQVSINGVEPDRFENRLYIMCIFTSLTLNLLGTFLCTFFTLKLSLMPRHHVPLFLRKMSTVLLLPNALIFMGALLFLVGLPFSAKALYGEISSEVGRRSDHG